MACVGLLMAALNALAALFVLIGAIGLAQSGETVLSAIWGLAAVTWMAAAYLCWGRP